MDNINPVLHPVLGKTNYQKMGSKAFWYMILENSLMPIMFVFLSIVIFVVTLQSFLGDTVLGESVDRYGLSAGAVCIMIAIIMEAVAVFAAWLHYITYVFLISEDGFKVKRGILHKTEIAIPYVQIQNVVEEQTLIFQIFGLSKLVILTAGDDQGSKVERDLSEGVIPVIDKKIAEALHHELLKRASIQKVVNIAP